MNDVRTHDHRERWDKQDVRLLKSLVTRKKRDGTTWAQIGAQLGRTANAASSKARRISGPRF